MTTSSHEVTLITLVMCKEIKVPPVLNTFTALRDGFPKLKTITKLFSENEIERSMGMILGIS